MRVADALFGVSLALSMTVTSAADAPTGKLLYETHCGTCHYEKLHERKVSKVSTLAALRAEVAKWAAQTNRQFTPAELDDIAEYLNQSHYKLTN